MDTDDEGNETDEYDVEPYPAQRKFDTFRKMVETYTETIRQDLFVLVDPFDLTSFQICYHANDHCYVSVQLHTTGESIDIRPCHSLHVLTRDVSTEESRAQAYECICKMMPECLSTLYDRMNSSGYFMLWPGDYVGSAWRQEMSIRPRQNSRESCLVIWYGPFLDKIRVSYVNGYTHVSATNVYDSSEIYGIIMFIVEEFSREE